MHVLVVCSGNTCRSPLAERLLRQKLTARGVSDVTVSSAGTGAWDGAPVSEGSYLVGLEVGIDLSDHRARLVSQHGVAQADLILTMSAAHLQRITELGGESKTHTLSQYAGLSGADAEVADPFGEELEVYRATLWQIDGLLDEVARRLAEERA